MQQFIVEAGDIIVSCAGTIGEIYELPPNAVSGVFNQALMRVRINATLIDKNIFIKVFSFNDRFNSLKYTVTVLRLRIFLHLLI